MQNITERSTGRERDVSAVEGRNVANDLRAVATKESRNPHRQSPREHPTRIANETLLKSSRIEGTPSPVGSFNISGTVVKSELQVELQDVQMSTIEQADRMNVIGLNAAKGGATPPTI